MLRSIIRCIVIKIMFVCLFVLFVYLFVLFVYLFVCQVINMCHNLTINKTSQSLKNGKFYFSVLCHYVGFLFVCLNMFLLAESAKNNEACRYLASPLPLSCDEKSN